VHETSPATNSYSREQSVVTISVYTQPAVLRQQSVNIFAGRGLPSITPPYSTRLKHPIPSRSDEKIMKYLGRNSFPAESANL
jgi:hypothetical protein